MQLTETLSDWATRRPQPAIALIIIAEISNLLLGLMAGSDLLAHFSPFLFIGLIAGLVFLRLTLKRFVTVSVADLPSHARFRWQKQAFFGMFVINLMAYTLAGGIAGHVIEHPEATTNLYGGITTVSSSSESRKLSIGEKIRQIQRKRTTDDASKNAWRRVGYVGLFLLGLVLAYFGAAMGCALICSEMGFLGILVWLLSTGVLAGGFYFLGRAIDKNMKPYQEMTRDERKREKRRYFRTLLVTVGGLVLLLLTSLL